MFKQWFISTTVLGLLIAPLSLADLKRLSDAELANTTAQSGTMISSLGRIPFAQSIYIEKAQLEDLYSTNKELADRALYYIDATNASITDRERLAEQIEMSLITFSTQLASTVTMSTLFPLLGLPIGIGVSAVPGAFDVEVRDVSIEMSMTIEVRE